MKQFKVNSYLTLKLENGKTNIYVKDTLFNQCKYLLLNIPIKKISSLEEIESVDEADEKLDKSLEFLKDQEEKFPPDVEFWGHCSNLQVWVENNYDTRLLHRNIAFPLLKKLTEIGDLNAKRVFKDEIIKRFVYGNSSVKEFLYIENYLSYLDIQELINGILTPQEADIMINLVLKSKIKYDLVMNFSEDKVRKRIILDKLYFSEKNGYVRELELDLNLCNYTIPKVLSQSKKLERLKIFLESENEIILNFITEFKSIKYLTINARGKIIIADHFEKFPNLYYLSINGNQGTKFEKAPNSIGNLKNLGWLEICSVSLIDFPIAIARLRHLESLILNSVYLETLPKSILNMASLEILNLDGKSYKRKNKNL
ncbi:MAG: hypothetical protein ACFFG0_40265 [Candidatus Thorarchaeota archaeon]